MLVYKRFWRVIYSTVVIAADISAYYVALIIAYQLRIFAESVLPAVIELQFSLAHFTSLWWVLAVILFFQLINGLYFRRDPLWIESGRILRSLALSFVVTLTVVSLGRMSGEVSRLFLCLLWGIMPFVFVIMRLFIKRALFKSPLFQEKVLVTGAGGRLESIAHSFESEKFMGIKVAVVYHLSKDTTESDIDKVLAENDISAAIIAPPAALTQSECNKSLELRTEDDGRDMRGSPADSNDLMPLFSYIQTKARKLFYIPASDALDITNAETGQLLRSQLGYLSVRNALQSSLNRLTKRLMDIALSILLTPLLIPLIVILTLAVKLSSPGPVLFSHERVGRGGKTFKVYKLRTMYKDAGDRLDDIMANDPAVKAEWDANFKLKNDPRVTPLGSFLRKCSLDELPQFFNVIKGDMSFVGPRPVLREELRRYYKEKAVYYNMAMPGITGLWQVSGRNDTAYADRVDMDCWYVFNWSLWLDAVILFSTPFAVILRKGAY